MFRNPREKALLPVTDEVRPSVGRPPTPPATANAPKSTQSPYFPSPTMNATAANFTNLTPASGRQPLPRASSSRKSGKQNQSILSFFGKAEKLDTAADKNDVPLFFKDAGKSVQANGIAALNGASTPDKAFRRDSQGSRFNEDDTPVKRRRIDEDDPDLFIRTPSPSRELVQVDKLDSSPPKPTLPTKKPGPVKKQRGGFIDDSSDEEAEVPMVDADSQMSFYRSEEQDPVHEAARSRDLFNEEDVDAVAEPTETIPLEHTVIDVDSNLNSEAQGNVTTLDNDVPTLHRDDTSMFIAGEFGDEEDFENEEFFEEGEEYMERRWMEEQRELEMGLDEDSKSESGAESVRTPQSNFDLEVTDDPTSPEAVSLCPMCNGSLKGLTEAQASSHVNACLDGAAPPLPSHQPSTLTAVPETSIDLQTDPNTAPSSSLPKRFRRAAVARPAQSNPFSLTKESKGGSAFTKLMSGHAEDAAWAEAAANEVHSRGKPAYQRTCPFYKIMPGLYICVDAFRYGKVEGQNAYFLSHFHSDHYIGLTSSWSHGPIYASKVTCNLMRQQLRVDPKWIIPLEFEKKVEVPNTNGVFVTMIPANHCPGSSLYLFEKVLGKNRDGSPRTTRVLHCGDFRACPAHVNHPLLRPDVLDAVTGLNKQQIIDTCYLDTTYLTPKYSFPSQYDVIDACAQMCVSLAKEIADSGDNWEKVKMERAGSTMTKFLEKGESQVVKKDEDDEDRKPRMRGRLLVVIGTYSIGKERICLGIAQALNSKIYAPPGKMRICAALEDPELNGRLTSNPLEAQVHMQTLMEIRAETLHDYLVTYKGHFARVVGFRPTGWSYRPPTSRFTENPAVQTVLHSDGWKSRFTMRDLVPQRGSTKESNCFGVPYSEHSSFRELTMFCCALRINRVIPTVNVGSARSREKMKGWIEKWDAEKKKNGLFKVEVGAEGWGSGDGQLRYGV